MSYPAYFLKEANADLRERIKNGGEELHDLILSMSDSEIEEFKQKAYEKYAQKPEFKIYLDASKNKDIVDFQQVSEAEAQKEFDRLMNEDLPNEQGFFSKVADDLSNIGKATVKSLTEVSLPTPKVNIPELSLLALIISILVLAWFNFKFSKKVFLYILIITIIATFVVTLL